MRELTKKELELIGGGYNTNEIVVTGGDDGDWGDFGDWWGDWGGDYGDDYGGDYGGDSGGGDEPPPEPEPDPCAERAEASKAANTMNAQNPVDPTTGLPLEQGSIIYRDPATGAIAHTPPVSGTPGNVPVAAPAGVGAGDILGFVHTHPPGASTGNAALDAQYANADRYPSPEDWAEMEGLVDMGVDASQLSIYIIDAAGDMRQFDYTDRAIYDVPVSDLLGQTGTPPPLPAPIDTAAPACPA